MGTLKATFSILALLVFVVGCGGGPRNARRELSEAGVQWSVPVFLESAQGGDVLVVELFLGGGMNPNATGDFGLTALMHAALTGQTGGMETLLNAGGDVNRKASDGLTALALAAASGQTESVGILIASGAEPTLKDKNSWGALTYAG